MTNRPPASRPVTDDFPNDLDAANGSFLHPPRPLAPPSPSVGVVDEPRPSWLEAPAAADVAAKVRAADVTPFESAPVSSRPSGSQVLDAQRGVAMSGPGDDSGAVGRFLTDLVGGSDHPKPLWYRKRVWYLTLCLAFAASPLIATLLALSTTTSASVESTTLASIAASTVDDEQPATRLSSARAGAAKPIPIPAAASAPVGLTPVPEPSGPEPADPTTTTTPKATTATAAASSTSTSRTSRPTEAAEQDTAPTGGEAPATTTSSTDHQPPDGPTPDGPAADGPAPDGTTNDTTGAGDETTEDRRVGIGTPVVPTTTTNTSTTSSLRSHPYTTVLHAP